MSRNLEDRDAEGASRLSDNGDKLNKFSEEKSELDESDISFHQAYPQIKLSTIASSFNVVIGVAFTFSAVLIPQLEGDDNDIPGVTKFYTSLMASIMILSVPVGSIAAGFMMDRIGRINTIRCAAIPSILGQIVMAIAPNVHFILVGRLLTGIACAMGVSPTIVYITEISPRNLRGSLVSMGPTIASFSMIFVFLGGSYLNWRTLAWLGIVFTCVPTAMTVVLKESPIYLVAKNRKVEAKEALEYIYSRYPNPEKVVKRKLEEIISAKAKETEARNGGKSMKLAGFLKPTGYKPLVMLIFLFIIQQFSGIYITLFFSVTFLQDIGISGDAASSISFYLSITRFIMSCLSIYLLQRFSRRHLVMISAFLMSAFMILSGGSSLLFKQGATQLEWVPVICILLYVCSSMLGMLPIPWSMTAELFPNDIRSLGQSISFSLANIIMFIAILSYRSLLDIFGGSYGVQWFFALVSFAAFLFGYKILPETHNVELSQIQAKYAGKKLAANQQARENQQLTPGPEVETLMNERRR